MKSTGRASDALVWVIRAMAWISGFILLILSFYITIDTMGRAFGWFYSGLTEGLSAYALAVAGSWGIAYALYAGQHVRIDLLLPMFPPRLRQLLDLLTLVLAGVFMAMLAYQTYLLGLRSFRLDTRSISTLQAPLYLPQFLLVLGLLMTVLVAALLTFRRFRSLIRGEPFEEVSAADEIDGGNS